MIRNDRCSWCGGHIGQLKVLHVWSEAGPSACAWAHDTCIARVRGRSYEELVRRGGLLDQFWRMEGRQFYQSTAELERVVRMRIQAEDEAAPSSRAYERCITPTNGLSGRCPMFTTDPSGVCAYCRRKERERRESEAGGRLLIDPSKIWNREQQAAKVAAMGAFAIRAVITAPPPLVKHQPFTRASAALHRLWSHAVDGPGYSKGDWMELEAAIVALGQRAIAEQPTPTAKQAESGPSAVKAAPARQFHRGPLIRYSEED